MRVDGNMWKSVASVRKPEQYWQMNDLAPLLTNIQKLLVEHLFREYGELR